MEVRCMRVDVEVERHEALEARCTCSDEEEAEAFAALEMRCLIN